MADTANLLCSIAARMSRSSEEAENQNKLQREQLNYIKEKDGKKKNKAKKWHTTSQRLVLNVAFTDSNFLAEKIPASYLSIINIDTAGMADKELQSQMAGLGLSNVCFAHSLAASLYAGDLKWNNHATPSNLSPFTFFKLGPLLATQSKCCMQLHILSKNTEGKLLEEIKASQIQEVKVPKSFEELHQVLSFYSGITSILFGTRSALVFGVKLLASAILTEKIIFKGCITTDGNLLTKIFSAMEIRIQCWLGECKKIKDRFMVNNHLVGFEEDFEMVMNHSLNVILPPNFIKSPPKNLTTTTTVTPSGDNEKQWGGGKKRKWNNNNGDRIIKNTVPITKFLMKEDEIWKQDFAAKCSRDCPKWNNTGTFMCARWWIRASQTLIWNDLNWR